MSDDRVDVYTFHPFASDYAARRQALFDYHAARPGNGIHSELVRLALGQPPDERLIEQALSMMNARLDCADFRLSGVIRLLYQFGGSPLVSQAMWDRVQESVLGFKYWPDELGPPDSMCSWSENHHILFASGGYLAGQFYPDLVFCSGDMTGRVKMAQARPRVLRWLDLRYQTGFSEWLSNVYYVEDLVPLLNLVDFCDDPEIASKAAMVLDLMLLDMALNHLRGTFGCTHGRSYYEHKVDGARESTASVFKLLFGLNTWHVGNMAAVSFALSSRYRMPAVLYKIATDLDRPQMESRQRVGIRLEESDRWGLDPRRLEDGMTYLSLEAYMHPRTIGLMVRMLDAYGWWENRFFAPFRCHRHWIEVAHRLHLLPLVARVFERDLTRNMRPEANITTYRTPDYMLSSVQDYRKGYGGDQQHVWSATLGPQAICFTTHPVLKQEGTPDYWTGSGNLPRVAQVENVAIVLYSISTRPGIYVTHRQQYTHAWFPRAQFDQVIEQDGWILARRGEGYLALWSHRPYAWTREGEWQDREVVAQGKRNVWICELGRRAADGDFESFCERLLAAPLRVRGLRVHYRSPSQGWLTFGWHSPLRQEGRVVSLDRYPRYENPYTLAGFPADRVEVRAGEHWLRLDGSSLEREASGYV